MPNTCSNCGNWRPAANTSLRADLAAVGECRGGTPCGDFKFPKTRANDYCSQHSACVSFATARAAVDAATAAHMETLREPGPEQKTFFDAGRGVAAPEKGRNGGPGAAVDASAPQSTAATAPVISPAAVRTPGADSAASGASRSSPRRTSFKQEARKP